MLLGLGAAAAHAADPAGDARRLILDASRALQGASAARFLSFFDKNQFAKFTSLRRNVVSLIETRTVASSVEVVSAVEERGALSVEVDWLLQLTPLAGPGPLDTRREIVQIRMAVGRKNGLKITSLEPVEFFRAR